MLQRRRTQLVGCDFCEKYLFLWSFVRARWISYQFLWIVDFHEDGTNEGIREIPYISQHCNEMESY